MINPLVSVCSMDLTKDVQRHSSDDVSSPPSIEKHFEGGLPVDVTIDADPDEHLSEAERKEIVRVGHHM